MQGLGHPPIRIDIGKKELPTGLEQPLHPLQHGELVGGEIHHAIGDHHIKTGGLQVQRLQPLDRARKKAHVGVAELPGMELPVGFGHRQLLRGHVDPHHLAAGADQLGKQIDIAAAATAQIQNPSSLQQGRGHQPTAVIARQHLGMDARQQRLEGLRHTAAITAGGGAQVLGARQGRAVVLLNSALHGRPGQGHQGSDQGWRR